MTFDEWLQEGINNQWISKIYCYTHDGVPLTSVEEDEAEVDLPCIASVRIFGDAGTPLDLAYGFQHQ